MKVSNGYILKFYKKIKNINKGNECFDFVSFMNFDGVKVFPVNCFSDYQKKTIDFNNPSEYDMNCSRQKLFIYDYDINYSNLKENEDIFDTNLSDFSKTYPILSISIINLKKTAIEKDTIKKIKQILDKKSLKYKIFGSLSVNKFVIVYRCKTFSELFKCNVYSLYPKLENIHSTYTIPCLLLSCASYWKEKDGLDISIRSSIEPQNQYYNTTVPRKTVLNGKRVYGLKKVKKYNVFGKYDLDIRGTIDSSRNFVENFKSGIFSQRPGEVNSLIRNTNTRFIYECKPGIVEKTDYNPDKVNKSIIEFQNNVSRISSSIISEHSNSSDFNQNLARLWLRTYQLLIRGRNNPMLDELCVIIEKYFKLANEYIDDLDFANSITLGLKSLNTLIDNRELNDFFEFENPHSNLMFSGCNTSLLSAYSNMAKKAFSVVKEINGESKEYISYITCDGYAEVSAREMFAGNDNCYYINIRIPTELMFDFKNLVCFILHEIGHNWDCLNNKDNELLEMFLDLSLRNLLIESKSRKDVCTNDDIDAIKEYTLNFLSHQNRLSEEVYNSISSVLVHNQICHSIDESHLLAKKIVNNLKIFDSAIEEAIADIFMIKFIGITSEEVYFNLVVDYLKYKNIHLDSAEFQKNNYSYTLFMRVAIVLIFLQSTDINNPTETREKIERTIENYIAKAEKSGFNSNKKIFGCFLLAALRGCDGNSLTIYSYAHKFYKYSILPNNKLPHEFREKFDFNSNPNGLLVQQSFEKYLNAGNDCEGFKEIIKFIDNMNHN